MKATVNYMDDPFEFIPSTLKQRCQWVVFRLEIRNGKSTKIPYSSANPSNYANVTDSHTWSTYGEAVQAMQKNDVNGIGFVFAREDAFCGIDLDHCRNPKTGEIEEWAQKIITDLDSYSEISPSGTGIHILVKGTLPPGKRRKGKIEMYDQERYFCMTGNSCKGTPRDIHERGFELELLHSQIFGTAKPDHNSPPIPNLSLLISNGFDDESVIVKAKQAINGDLFSALWEGNFEKYDSRSEADLALCSLLRFWTGGNPQRIDCLFRQSGLYREKWDEKHYSDGRTYGQATIEQALKGSTEIYQPKSHGQDFRSSEIRFPLEVLPSPLREYTQKLAEALPVPIDLVGVSVLVAAASVIGASRVIEVKPGWHESPIIFLAIVGDPGTLKSPMLHDVLQPISQYQAKLEKEFNEAYFVYKQDKLVYEKEKQLFTKGKRESPPCEPQEPTMKRVRVGDITVERLGVMLSENPEGLLLACDELSAWVKSQNQYKGGKGADRSFYLSLWNAAQIIIDRQKTSPIIVNNPVMSIMGCIPPAVLPELQDKENREDGFIHRILFAYPKPVRPYWEENSVPEEIQQNYENLVKGLIELRKELHPSILKFTPSAKETFKVWHDAHVEEFSSPTFPPNLKGFYAKLRGYCARLALILAVCSDPKTQAVDRESVEGGCALTEYFKAQAEAILPLLNPGKPTPEKRCEQAILRNLETNKEQTRRNIQRSVSSSPEIFHKVLDGLVEAKCVMKMKNPNPKGSEIFKLAKEDR